MEALVYHVLIYLTRYYELYILNFLFFKQKMVCHWWDKDTHLEVWHTKLVPLVVKDQLAKIKLYKGQWKSLATDLRRFTNKVSILCYFLSEGGQIHSIQIYKALNKTRKISSIVEDMVNISWEVNWSKFVRRLIYLSKAVNNGETMLFNYFLNLVNWYVHSPMDTPISSDSFSK